MTRCPNCGSAIRIGAKFCTSCGFRLTVDEPALASPAAPSRSPFATTSSPAWSAEPAVRATADVSRDLAGRTDVVEVVEVVEVEPAWSSVEDDEATTSEPVYEVVADTPTSGERTDSRVVRPEEGRPVATTWFGPAPRDTGSPVSDEMTTSPQSDQPDQLRADIGDESRERADEPDEEDDAAPPDGRTTDVGDVAPAVMTADPGNSIESGASLPSNAAVDPLDEARALAARLSEVLAAVQTGGGPAPARSPAVSSIADESDVEALRAVVKSAQERPRDVDVMLDLVLRADTIDAVIADRDLLLAALRGDESAVEESWPSDDEQPSTYPAWGS